MKAPGIVLLTLLGLAIGGCTASSTDGEYPIADGYFFYDTGDGGKTIQRQGEDGLVTTIVDERVDSYRLSDGRILVARRPADIVWSDGNPHWKIEPTCEYWVIDLASGAVSRQALLPKAAGVSCR